MKKLTIAMGVLVALLLLFVDIRPASGQLVEAKDSTPGWKLAIGSLCSLSWIAFILTSVFCTFYIDRKKVAEAEHWIPAGYTFPPRKYLKSGGQLLASLRLYTLVSSVVLLLVVLSITL